MRKAPAYVGVFAYKEPRIEDAGRGILKLHYWAMSNIQKTPHRNAGRNQS